MACIEPTSIDEWELHTQTEVTDNNPRKYEGLPGLKELEEDAKENAIKNAFVYSISKKSFFILQHLFLTKTVLGNHP